MASNNYKPKPEHKFTFGLWTVGNRGRDPFGDATRSTLSPVTIVKRLSELGAYGVNLHDNDLVPIDATAAERDRIVREFKQALDDSGMKVPMATTNLFYDPVFKDGAFTSSDPRVRLYALQKTMRSMDLGAELGAKIYVFWGVADGDSWLNNWPMKGRTNYPLLFDRLGQPKPALEAVIDTNALEQRGRNGKQ